MFAFRTGLVIGPFFESATALLAFSVIGVFALMILLLVIVTEVGLGDIVLTFGVVRLTPFKIRLGGPIIPVFVSVTFLAGPMVVIPAGLDTAYLAP